LITTDRSTAEYWIITDRNTAEYWIIRQKYCRILDNKTEILQNIG
jgi:hypothetical protein